MLYVMARLKLKFTYHNTDTYAYLIHTKVVIPALRL